MLDGGKPPALIVQVAFLLLPKEGKSGILFLAAKQIPGISWMLLDGLKWQ